MSQLPPAILFDLDDTILSAFGQAEGQWQRVVAEFIEHLAPHPPDDIVTAIQAYSRYLWADQTRHKHWRHRIGEARRHIVQNAFAELCAKAGQPAPSAELCDRIADRFNDIVAANRKMAKELARVGQVVGRQGKTRQRMSFDRSAAAQKSRTLRARAPLRPHPDRG